MSVDVLPTATAENKSTNVRKMKPPPIALPLRLLEKVSANLAGRATARAFFTTMRPKVRPEDADTLGHGERLSIPFGRERLAAWEFGDDGPTVILSHGWSGRAPQLAAVAYALGQAGFRAVVFDHPAHGESPGTSTTIPTMAQALAEVDAYVGGAHAVVAHSMGSVITTFAMTRTIKPLRVAYLAPTVEPPTWLSSFSRALGLSDKVLPSMQRAIEARAGLKLEAFDHLALARAQAAPLLVVHDRADKDVPFAAGQALAAHWPGARLATTDGFGHYRMLRRPEVISEVVSFLAPLK